MSTEERASYWRSLIEEQVSSGLSISAFCRKHHKSPYQLYRWRRRFRQTDTEGVSAGFLELIPRPDHPRSGVRILIGTNLCIDVERGFDPATLRSVVEILDMK